MSRPFPPPQDPTENARYRQAVLRAARENPELCAYLRDRCRDDILFYVNAFVWQYNPQHVGREVGPFVTWDFQDEALLSIVRAVRDREDVAIVKSREMGASWMCLLACEWFWHFHQWVKVLVVSRNAESVDKRGDPDSLFWKLDFIHQNQPDWLLPKGYAPLQEPHRKKMFFGNPETGSTITGQATTEKAGVGGRATLMFVDEFSQIREDKELIQRTADTTGCRIFNFTHVGTDTEAYRLSERTDVRRILLHWSMHPEKRKGLYRARNHTRPDLLDPAYTFPPDYPFVLDGSPGGPFAGLRSPWYDRECRRRDDPRGVAMDLDIDARGATSQFFDPVRVRDLTAEYARPPLGEYEVHLDHQTGEFLSLVPSPAGRLKLWLPLTHQGRTPEGRYAVGADVAGGVGKTSSCLGVWDADSGEKVAEWACAHTPPESFAPLAAAVCRLFSSPESEPAKLNWEAHGPGATFGKVVLELGFSNVYLRRNEEALSKKVTDTPGWAPTPKNKRRLLDTYRAALYSRRAVNRSREALDDLLNFRYTTQGHVEHGSSHSKDGATSGENHGDQAMADALGWMLVDQAGLGRKKSAAREETPVGSLAWRRRLNHTSTQAADRWWE